MNSNPTLTIVIPAYNEERYLEACLTHVQAEIERSGVPVTVLVIDNASTDGTAAIVKSMPGVQYIHEPKKGLTRARQCGLDAVQTLLVAYVDADTRMPAGWIPTVLAAFENDAQTVCVSGPYRYYDASVVTNAFVRMWWMLGSIIYRLIGYMAVGGNFCIRTEAMRSIGGFDTTIEFYGEDTDMARRMACVGRVQFTGSLVMPTSARRFTGEGTLTTGIRYAVNFISIATRKKPSASSYSDIR